MLFENQGQWKQLSSADLNSQLNQYTIVLGLDSETFNSCLSRAIANEIHADFL